MLDPLPTASLVPLPGPDLAAGAVVGLTALLQVLAEEAGLDLLLPQQLRSRDHEGHEVAHRPRGHLLGWVYEPSVKVKTEVEVLILGHLKADVVETELDPGAKGGARDIHSLRVDEYFALHGEEGGQHDDVHDAGLHGKHPGHHHLAPGQHQPHLVLPEQNQSLALLELAHHYQCSSCTADSPSARMYPEFTLQLLSPTASTTCPSTCADSAFPGLLFVFASTEERSPSAYCVNTEQFGGGTMLTKQLLEFIFLQGQNDQGTLCWLSSVTNFQIQLSEFQPDSPIQMGTEYLSRKARQLAICQNTGSVQYLWKLYIRLESKGLPNTEKSLAQRAPSRIIMWFLSTSLIAATIFLQSGQRQDFRPAQSKLRGSFSSQQPATYYSFLQRSAIYLQIFIVKLTLSLSQQRKGYPPLSSMLAPVCPPGAACRSITRSRLYLLAQTSSRSIMSNPSLPKNSWQLKGTLTRLAPVLAMNLMSSSLKQLAMKFWWNSFRLVCPTSQSITWRIIDWEVAFQSRNIYPSMLSQLPTDMPFQRQGLPSLQRTSAPLARVNALPPSGSRSWHKTIIFLVYHYNPARMGNQQNTTEHRRLGTVVYSQNGLLKVHYDVPKKLFDSWEKLINDFKSLDCQFVFQPIEHEAEVVGICSTNVNLRMRYPDYRYVLANEISQRAAKSGHYSQQQLLFIAFSLLRVGLLFQSRKRTFGSICTKNVLVNEMGHLKVLTSCTSPLQTNGMIEALERSSQPFLAPEQLKAIRQRNYNAKFRPGLAQSFSIGLVLLEAATLKPSSALFDYGCYEFDWIRCKRRMQEAEGRHGGQVCQLMRMMLVEDSRQRPCVGQLATLLTPYSESIIDMAEFKICQSESRRCISNYLDSWNDSSQSDQQIEMAGCLHSFLLRAVDPTAVPKFLRDQVVPIKKDYVGSKLLNELESLQKKAAASAF